MRYPALAAAASLALAGCAAAANSTPPALSHDLARLGETVELEGRKLTPLALVEDSRCPVSVVCAWAGRVRVSARLVVDSRSQELTLTQGEPIGVAGGRLELVEVRPPMNEPGAIPPEEYRFGFRFTAGASSVASEYDQAAMADFFVDPT